jgi:hypothetical protein
LAHLAVVTDLQLCRNSLRLRQRRAGSLRIAGNMADLALLAEELGIFFGLRLDLGLARRERGLSFVELALLGKEEGEGAAEGAGSTRRGLVTGGNGLAEYRFGFPISREMSMAWV